MRIKEVRIYDIAIIGAGMAGLTAAIYGRRAGKTVLVLESKIYGGQIMNTLRIENWPGDYGVSGAELMKKVYQQAVELGAEIKYEEVTKVDRSDGGFTVKTDDGEYKTSAVVLAVGTEDKKLGIPGENGLVGCGVSYCATCDGALYEGKTVVVVGGGNTALYDALYLSDVAKKVYVVHRREALRGDVALVDKVRAKRNVEFLLGRVITEIMGNEKVVEVRLDDGKVLDVEGVFVAVGKVPATEKFANLVKVDSEGYVVASEDCITSCDGIYAAGDCRTKTTRQLVTAASDGAIAIGQAVQYIK